ncbi:tRNA (guanosine(37)-N1)-methyltransferase TrmD [Lysinibacter sp. HNR]|uniref:tRNA (guanosine(37)-N1)-methyltransferase TrmD n=1 Tax=Lysinibacter sp. HNR TaxID=3031408 RepID=UPI002434D7FD|nr:tRNA (guanosine(37)-N1)-methyltransferase TrmD [Lysinibacter sp. HNR]WGD38415.1 tRNA (guanosine(37)-N1)-methyltransferase TrmD [Lysinibacter sp. HNR]
MKIDIVSIFPSFFDVLDISLLGKAMQNNVIDLTVHDLRDFTYDRHRTVDDRPYGGGAGMVMKPEPWGRALDLILEGEPGKSAEARVDAPGAAGFQASAEESRAEVEGIAETSVDATVHHKEKLDSPLVIFPSPAGEVFRQSMAKELAAENHVIFGCGRYEGIDQRVFEYAQTRARVRLVSLGDYVLNGGEVATMAMIEAIGRLIPGVIGNPESLAEESHEDGLLEYPSYTKPSVWRGYEVPPVLLAGNHAVIERWRHEQSVERTRRVRPDLLKE